MKKLLLILGWALCSVTLYAQPVCPPQAAASGFTNLVFDDEFTSTTFTTTQSSAPLPAGKNWAIYEWGRPQSYSLNTGAGTGALAGATGVFTIQNGNFSTVPTYASYPNGIATPPPGTWRHGYYEARIQFNATPGSPSGWPAFWTFGASAHVPATGAAWTSGHTFELDFFEAWNNAGRSFNFINTLHDWQHGTNAVAGSDTGHNTNNDNYAKSLIGTTELAQPTDGKWHTYGCLHQQTGPNTGYVEFYLDNHLIVHPSGSTRVLTGAGTPFPDLETDAQFIIIGGGQNWPINVDWVHVWQGGGTPPPTTGTLTQSVTGFPATENLQISQPTYTLPATTSAGQAIAYTVVSGPATVSGNILTLTGAGNIALTASAPGNGSYAAWSATETITVTLAPQALSAYPQTITLPSMSAAGLPITWTASGEGTLAGNVLTINGSGMTTLTGSQAGNATYAPATVTETITNQ